MPSGFCSKALLIRDLFSDPYVYHVPVFQRSFSWTTEHAQRLLMDFLEANEERAAGGAQEGVYLLGSILLVDRDPGNVNQTAFHKLRKRHAIRHVDVVDGQQRLITLTIMLCVLRDLDESDGRMMARALSQLIGASDADEPYRVGGQELEATLLIDYVQTPDATAIEPAEPPATDGERNILAVRDYFVDILSDMTQAEREEIAEFVLGGCGLAGVFTSNMDCAIRMFASLNGTGLPLSISDVMKAEILRDIEGDERNRYVSAWHDAKVALDEDFKDLFSHLRVVCGKRNKQIIASLRELLVEAGSSGQFMDDVLLPMAGIYGFVLGRPIAGAPEIADEATRFDVERSLYFLRLLKSHDWVPVAMLFISKHRDEPAQIAKFLGELERFAYMMQVQGLGGPKRIKRYKVLIDWIDAGGDQQNVASEANGDDPKDREELGEMRAQMDFSRKEYGHINRNLRNLHNRDPQVCKLLLVRLSAELALRQQVEAGASTVQVERLALSDYTVEHVLPKRLPHNSDWKRLFPDYDQRNSCTGCLGNLVLLTQGKNGKASTADFARKKEVYFEKAELSLPAITKSLAEVEEWTPEVVFEREHVLIDLLQSIWDMELLGFSRSSQRGIGKGDSGTDGSGKSLNNPAP